MGVQTAGVSRGPSDGFPGASRGAEGPGLGPAGEVLACRGSPGCRGPGQSSAGLAGRLQAALHGGLPGTSPEKRPGCGPGEPKRAVSITPRPERHAPGCRHRRGAWLQPHGPACAHPPPPGALEGMGLSLPALPPPGAGSACEGSVCATPPPRLLTGDPPPPRAPTAWRTTRSVSAPALQRPLPGPLGTGPETRAGPGTVCTHACVCQARPYFDTAHHRFLRHRFLKISKRK